MVTLVRCDEHVACLLLDEPSSGAAKKPPVRTFKTFKTGFEGFEGVARSRAMRCVPLRCAGACPLIQPVAVQNQKRDSGEAAAGVNRHARSWQVSWPAIRLVPHHKKGRNGSAFCSTIFQKRHLSRLGCLKIYS